MQSKKIKRRASRKRIVGGFFSQPVYKPVFGTSPDKEVNDSFAAMDRVAGIIFKDPKLYSTEVLGYDKRNMSKYFKDSGSIDLLQKFSEDKLEAKDFGKFKVVLSILKAIFLSKEYNECVKVITSIETSLEKKP